MEFSFEYPLNGLINKLLNLFTAMEDKDASTAPVLFQRCGLPIRFHIENVSDHGDLSIANNSKYWEAFCRKHGRKMRLHTDKEMDLVLPNEESMQFLIEQAKDWVFPLQEITPLYNNRCTFSFQRRPVIDYVLRTVLQQGARYGHHSKLDKAPTLCLTQSPSPDSTLDDGTEQLGHYRLRQLLGITRRLMAYSTWRLVDLEQQSDDTLRVTVEAQRCPKQPTDHVCLVCGPVLEPVGKTATTINKDSYVTLRSKDMILMAMHRNGVRMGSSRGDFDALIQRLGAAAVIVDLFEVRHASAANVVRNGSGSSKGASYILYNSARLETLLRTFNAQVEAGVYQPLPPLADIDLSLLEDDLDWKLIYGHLLPFPEVVESTLNLLQQGQCDVHLLVRYISSLASLFSRYYRQKRILVQMRDQLMPVLYARVYLVMAVRQVLNVALSLLGIEPVSYI
ncbi:DALR anticodon-binding domain-containing protein 3 isoform X2 [Drosophila obscura]|uniref:DALR anticodon-binding domain-containing protein 3 isoform X2 n=1 Tax=Drosophila obscura TaxID=7282 RepID=UPI001BB272AB|nr:DALR anticodon-binding domain-containing protein 3 isoform X2 [Drosophila obscura]